MPQVFIITLLFVTLVSCRSVTTTEEAPGEDVSNIETTSTPRQHQRIPKTAKTTTTTSTTTTTTTPKPRKIATHPSWDPITSSTSKPRATHAPWPGDDKYYGNSDSSYAAIINNHNKPARATHAPYPFRDQYSAYLDQNEHLYPSRSTYAPYVYGSSNNLSNDAKKKNLVLSILDKEFINNWAKDVLAYLAAPFMMPSAISNAVTNIPSGLEAETFWGKIARSLRSALLKRSGKEERTGGGEPSASSSNTESEDNNLLASLIRKKLVPATSQLTEVVSKRFKDISSVISAVSSMSTPIEKSNDKKDFSRDETSDDSMKKKKKSIDKKGYQNSVVPLVKFIDFFRVKKHRQDPPAVIKSSSR